MKRGGQFFEKFSEVPDEFTGGKKRGRSSDLLSIRNNKIFHRYYYYSRILQYKYELVMAGLVEDFDLSESTLFQLIEKNTEAIKGIGQCKPTRAQLKRKFPSLSWGHKAATIEIGKRDKKNI